MSLWEQWVTPEVIRFIWMALPIAALLCLITNAVLLAKLKTHYPDLYYAVGSPKAGGRDTRWFIRLGRYRRTLPDEITGLYWVSLAFFYLAMMCGAFLLIAATLRL